MKILIAEDEAIPRKLLEASLRKFGHEVLSVENGRQAWEILAKGEIRMVIADWMMPEMDGLELIRRIRKIERPCYVYTILLTARGNRQDLIEGLSAGADDYLVKPFDVEELRVRIRGGERLIRLEEELAARNEQLREMAMVDGLTGIGNRRAFDEALARLAEQSRRFRHPFGVMMLDIDRFKLYNDTLGHEAGDLALKQTAKVVAERIRVSDAAYRYGGEEFVCLLPETDLQGAEIVAGRVREAVERCAIPHAENPPTGVITVSVGVAGYHPLEHRPAAEVVRSADHALYAAKKSGRNRVEIAKEPVSG